MWSKIPQKDRSGLNYILDPQAGDGKIIEYLKDNFRYYHSKTIHAIEIDPQLQTILHGKKITVIDSDFLLYAGPDKYDLIMMNPPFSNGDAHLLKAIDIMYSGHIVCLINAETIKNPYTNSRKLLVQKLNDLNADIEFIQDAFLEAERKTAVEVALVYIHIKRDIETDLFQGLGDAIKEDHGNAHEENEIAHRDAIGNLVLVYNRIITIGTQSLLDFYKNYHHVSNYLTIGIKGEEENRFSDVNDNKKLTALMQEKLNTFVSKVRVAYWRKVLNLDKVAERMTVKKLEEFNVRLQNNSQMDFTENNIRTFILNLINSYEDILKEAVQDLFQKLTIESAYHETLHTKNIHYFNGWKTNKAYRVGKRVIVNMGYKAFIDWSGRWYLDWDAARKLDDIDKVMNYFDGRSEYVSIRKAIDQAYQNGQTSGIESTYFRITTHKKGTMHLMFLNDDILRRFNITACKSKNFLPEDYGRKPFEDVKDIDFEDKKTYEKNISNEKSLFYQNHFLKIAS